VQFCGGSSSQDNFNWAVTHARQDGDNEEFKATMSRCIIIAVAATMIAYRKPGGSFDQVRKWMRAAE
jgi:hypothetical protein